MKSPSYIEGIDKAHAEFRKQGRQGQRYSLTLTAAEAEAKSDFGVTVHQYLKKFYPDAKLIIHG